MTSTDNVPADGSEKEPGSDRPDLSDIKGQNAIQYSIDPRDKFYI